MKKDYTNKEYQDYVEKKAPKSKILKDTLLAFVIGGLICVLAELIADYMRYRGAAEETVQALPTVMVALWRLPACWYDRLAKYAGAERLCR